MKSLIDRLAVTLPLLVEHLRGNGYVFTYPTKVLPGIEDDVHSSIGLDDDNLIGGRTTFVDDNISLDAIRQVWASKCNIQRPNFSPPNGMLPVAEEVRGPH